MLVIRRHPGDSIRIGDDIEIHILELSPSKVTVGVNAPRAVSVTRGEIALTKEQNLAAADSFTVDRLTDLTGAVRRVL